MEQTTKPILCVRHAGHVLQRFQPIPLIPEVKSLLMSTSHVLVYSTTRASREAQRPGTLPVGEMGEVLGGFVEQISLIDGYHTLSRGQTTEKLIRGFEQC